MNKILYFLISLLIPLTCLAQPRAVSPKLPGDDAAAIQPSIPLGEPVEIAKGEKLSKASGYFARARNLLIAAIHEFDQGVAIVDPSSMLEVNIWRTGVTSRIDELGRVLDPQPRVSKGGARYEAQPKLLGSKGKK